MALLLTLAGEFNFSKTKLAAVVCLMVLVVASIYSGWMSYAGLSSWLGYMVLFFTWRKTRNSWVKQTLFAVLILGFLLFAARLLPGIERVTLIRDVFINNLGVSTDLKFSLDKTLAGVTVLLFLATNSKTNFSNALNLLLKSTIFLLVFYWLAWLSVLSWQPKLPNENVLAFMLFNVLFTCIPEEAFFRLMIQKPIFTRLQNASFIKSPAHVGLVSIVITSLLFTVLHIPWAPSASYLVFVFAAGCFYAWVYHMTRSVTASVLAHFSLNAIHMLLFSYP